MAISFTCWNEIKIINTDIVRRYRKLQRKWIFTSSFANAWLWIQFFSVFFLCLNSVGDELTRWVRLMMNFALIKNLFYHWDWENFIDMFIGMKPRLYKQCTKPFSYYTWKASCACQYEPVCVTATQWIFTFRFDLCMFLYVHRKKMPNWFRSLPNL